jgi:excisionase family DNA binding protein
MGNVIQIKSTRTPQFDPIEVEQTVQTGSFEPFVDEEVIARFLGIKKRRILEMARKGEIPAHPIGRGRKRKTWRFRMSEIEAHFSASAVKHSGATMTVAVPVTQERKRLG